nr:stromal cell-derived factor 2-like protein 1 [Odocoileus virginianus texanus]
MARGSGINAVGSQGRGRRESGGCAGQGAGGPQGRRPAVSRARWGRRSERRTWACYRRRAGGGERLGEPLGPRVEVVGKAEVVRGEGRRCHADGHPGYGVSSPGSGQQSVTGVEASDDANSYWRIRGGTEGGCPRGSPVRCGQAVRLTHVLTGKNLHTHHFRSPLSNNQEVSAFGEDGEGDDLDLWTVRCSGQHWEREAAVRFQHVGTSVFLSVTGEQYGSPIRGQHEVHGMASASTHNKWKAMEGIFIKPSPEAPGGHDELRRAAGSVVCRQLSGETLGL